MTRTIKARDIKPGMTIRWGEADITHQCPLASVERFNNDQDIQGETPQGQVALLHGDDDVLVVKEPPQPEEPTEFGALRWVGDRCFVRLDEAGERHLVWYEKSRGVLWGWEDLCKMGPVTVVPDQGWTVPDTTEVPERIEEWPDDDTALRAHKWRDVYGDVWVYVDGAWRWGIHPYGDYETPIGDPWTRVTDA